MNQFGTLLKNSFINPFQICSIRYPVSSIRFPKKLPSTIAMFKNWPIFVSQASIRDLPKPILTPDNCMIRNSH